ncbi:hypothetical protein ACFC58_17300 [Kitasatospora purpeofusca]|uniref:hypothetical protein n=1 Tax=Kitasatospora purpeofusca TaxID=67352 RepID=UPI0035DBD389
MNDHRRRRLRRRLENEIDRLWGLLGLTEYSKPSFDFAEGHLITVGADGRLGYLYFERGVKEAERITRDVPELLYWVAADAVCGPGGSWEGRAAALYALDPAWAERWCAELAASVRPERQHEVPVLPPETPFVLRKPAPRPRKPRFAAPAPAVRSGSGSPGHSCERCRPRSTEELPAFPRFRLLGQ